MTRSKEELRRLLATHQLTPEDVHNMSPEEREILKGLNEGSIFTALFRIGILLVLIYVLAKIFIL